jgi:cytochrome c2
MTTMIKVSVIGAALVWPAGAYALEGNAEHGKTVFNQCKACHQVGPGAKAGVGPEQNNLIGSKAGSRSGYNYSAVMKDAGEKGLVWTEENVDKYLESPKAMVPGTKMIYPGLKNPQDRADVIAYLKTETKE